MNYTGHWCNMVKGQTGENTSAIYFLPKKSFWATDLKGVGDKIIGMRVGERGDYNKDFCTCCKILMCLVCFVASFKLSFV